MQEFMTFLSAHSALTFAAVGVFLLVIIVELLRAKQSIQDISPLKATQMINHDNAVIVDTRPNDAFRLGHIIDAVTIPANEIKQLPKKLEKLKTRPIIIVCARGLESRKIATFLTKNGYNAHSLAGGLRAWSEAQLPTVKE